MDADFKSVVIEARARVIWGDRVSDVGEWMVEQGVDPQAVEEILAPCLRERAAEVRRIGVRDLMVGIPLVVLGVGAFVAVSRYHIRAGRLLGVPVLAVVYGVWRIVKGLDRVLGGAKSAGSIPDM